MAVRIPGQTTKVRSFSAFVRAANPDFDLERRKEPAWEFEGGRVKRIFYQDIRNYGPYNLIFVDFLLLETGGELLLESGDQLLLENAA